MSDPITDRLDAIEEFLMTLHPTLAAYSLSDMDTDDGHVAEAANAIKKWKDTQGVWKAKHGAANPPQTGKPVT